VEVEVRFSALEAIAALADNCGVDKFQDHKEVMDLLLAASREQTDDGAPPPESSDGTPTLYRPHSEIRAVAAYALGVIGGDQAQSRLRLMLVDGYPNARFNAATGLARWGDAQCLRVLREMLDSENELAVRDEKYPEDRAYKRTTVLLNGIKATLQLAETNPSADLHALDQALQTLADSPLDGVKIERNKVKRAAAEALRRLEDKRPAAQP
jgi:HEAT repeat protein